MFITPLARRLFAEKDETYRHTAWAEAMKRTGERLNVPVIDLTAMSEQLIARSNPEEVEWQWYMNIPGEKVDNTHLKPLGAVKFAGLIARGLHELGGEYAQLLCEDFDQWMEA